MSDATAVLSYTRKDDEFFGGYITSFRKSLELAVHVVTGEETFRLFQDIDGIVIGEQWQKKIAEVIDRSTFLIPMMSPLFFSSEPCREEVELFLAHEKTVTREDLILPVYFVESPRLEKPEERAKDRIAMELGKRERFDWREKATLPLQDSPARAAMLTLAQAIAKAIQRLAEPKPPVGHVAAAPPVEIPANVREAHRAGVEAIARRDTPGTPTRRESPRERHVLWVDDQPNNNRRERRAMETYGVRFTIAKSTNEALEILGTQPFDAIISDMGRPGDPKAGYSLLGRLRTDGNEVPYFIYCGPQARFLKGESTRLGANGITNEPDTLISMVIASLR
jgi:CheY-like chemotaxis protein